MVLLRSSCCPVPWNWPCGLRWRGIVDDWVMIAGLVVGCRLFIGSWLSFVVSCLLLLVVCDVCLVSYFVVWLVCLRCLLLFWLWFVVGRFRLLLFLVAACGLACGTQSKLVDTWRIIPFSKWLISMVIVSPLSKVIPLPNGLKGPISGGY